MTQQANQETTALTRKELVAAASDTITKAIRECGVLAIADQPPLMQAVRLATGIRMIRGALGQTFIEENFMPLMGSPLGFLTDKDAEKEKYDWTVVRDVLCEALLRGFQPVNNEFNIIARRFYGAKNGFERIVRGYPGLRDLEMDLGVPRLVADKGALVPCEARWFYLGEAQILRCGPPTKEGEIDTSIPVKVNSGMGPDAILGKATRKLYARIYQRLTGCSNEIVEGEVAISMPVESLPAPAEPAEDGKRISMGKKTKGDQADQPMREPGQEG